jgi:hypothetical protein
VANQTNHRLRAHAIANRAARATAFMHITHCILPRRLRRVSPLTMQLARHDTVAIPRQ